MDHLNINISSPQGSPWIHITVQGKGHPFHHTEQFNPTVSLGDAVKVACNRFLEELTAWTKFVESLHG